MREAAVDGAIGMIPGYDILNGDIINCFDIVAMGRGGL